ncbi:MAG: hypothetical protein JOY95_01925 [Silvibacterium sp.]|nr:hypothetical protein [Silvibacterium sp.]
MRIDQHRRFGLPEHIDKAGRDDHAVRINEFCSGSVAEHANTGDMSVRDANVAGVPRRTGTVDDAAVADDDVIVWLGRGQASGE